jgi:hypothetical protein
MIYTQFLGGCVQPDSAGRDLDAQPIMDERERSDFSAYSAFSHTQAGDIYIYIIYS